MAIDWTSLFTKYRGKWVALEKDESTVISSGATAKIAFDEAKSKGFDDPILTKMPTDLLPLVG